jgi:hypothetical protein
MSLRTKVANTLGPSSLVPVLRKTGSVPLGPDTTADPYVPPPPGAWLMEDPLSSMASLTSNGVGTWDVASGYLNMASPPNAGGVYIRHSYQINAAHELHVMECEVRIPTNFTTSSDAHIDIGWNTATTSSDQLYLSAKAVTTTQTINYLLNEVAWAASNPYTWTSGRWYRLRSVWNTASNTFTGYVDGVVAITYTRAQSDVGRYPALALYRSGGTSTNFSFRNLKYWGGAATDSPPTSWLMEDSLSSTSNFTFSGGGTWDTASGWMNLASPANDTTTKAKYTYPISSAFDRHILQCEIRIPSNFTNGIENHVEMGFSSGANGDVFLSAKSRPPNRRASWLKIAVSWTEGPTYLWVDAQWYVLRLEWNVPSTAFSGYVDGVYVTGFSSAQSETNMHPYFALYKASSTSANFSFRNLKYWGGALTDQTP